MAYIGVDINYGNIASQTGVGDGTTTPIATLSYSVPTSSSIMVTLDGVTQVPTTDYTASGTTLTFTSTVASPIAILVYFLGRSLDIGTPADNTVTNAKMANNAIDSAELVAGSVDLAHMSAESVDSDQYVDGSIDTIHIGDDQVTGAKLNPALVAGDVIYADGTDTINRLAKPATPAGEVLTFATSATAPSWVAPAGGGKVLQVIQTHDTTARSQSVSTTRSVITGLNVTITPTATTSKIYITVRWVGELNHADNHTLTWGIRRDSTDVGNPPADGSRTLGLTIVSQGYWNSNSDDTPDSAYMDYLDSPSTTSAITYHGTIWSQTARTLYTNRTVLNSNNNSTERLASSITVWEIGA